MILMSGQSRITHKGSPESQEILPELGFRWPILISQRWIQWCLLFTPRSGSVWLWVTPWTMRSILNWIKDEYNNPPVLITENGMSDRNGTLEDDHRIFYYKYYINYMLQGKCSVTLIQFPTKKSNGFVHRFCHFSVFLLFLSFHTINT